MVRDDKKISNTLYSFSALADTVKAAENAFIDVLVVVKRVDPLTSIMSVKHNKYIDKRTVLLCDKSGTVFAIFLNIRKAIFNYMHYMSIY